MTAWVRIPDYCGIFQLRANICLLYLAKHFAFYVHEGKFEIDQNILWLPHDPFYMMSVDKFGMMSSSSFS